MSQCINKVHKHKSVNTSYFIDMSFFIDKFILNELEFICLVANGFKYSYLSLIILFDINHLFAKGQRFQISLFNISYFIWQLSLSNKNYLHTVVWFQVNYDYNLLW